MSDKEIFNYLDKHNFSVDAQDCLMKVINTSLQIEECCYDGSTSIMTIITPENTFEFKWILGNP